MRSQQVNANVLMPAYRDTVTVVRATLHTLLSCKNTGATVFLGRHE